MSVFPQVESYGHVYWIVPSELLDGVKSTEPADGMADSWGEYDYDGLTELFAERYLDLAAELPVPDGPNPNYRPMRFPPGCFVIIEYMPDFDAWSIMGYMIFPDADDARGWLLEECGPPGRFTEYIGDMVVLDKDMPPQLRAYRADPRRVQ
jgi:hypothetical protein